MDYRANTPDRTADLPGSGVIVMVELTCSIS
jgi:hypothetical protein